MPMTFVIPPLWKQGLLKVNSTSTFSHAFKGYMYLRYGMDNRIRASALWNEGLCLGYMHFGCRVPA